MMDTVERFRNSQPKQWIIQWTRLELEEKKDHSRSESKVELIQKKMKVQGTFETELTEAQLFSTLQPQ